MHTLETTRTNLEDIQCRVPCKVFPLSWMCLSRWESCGHSIAAQGAPGGQGPSGCGCLPACRSQTCVAVEGQSTSHAAWEVWRPNQPPWQALTVRSSHGASLTWRQKVPWSCVKGQMIACTVLGLHLPMNPLCANLVCRTRYHAVSLLALCRFFAVESSWAVVSMHPFHHSLPSLGLYKTVCFN